MEPEFTRSPTCQPLYRSKSLLNDGYADFLLVPLIRDGAACTALWIDGGMQGCARDVYLRSRRPGCCTKPCIRDRSAKYPLSLVAPQLSSNRNSPRSSILPWNSWRLLLGIMATRRQCHTAIISTVGDRFPHDLA